jgi:hypothetical protein
MSGRRKSGGLAAEALQAIVGGAEATADIVAVVGVEISAPLRALRAKGLIIQTASGRHAATDKGREAVAAGAVVIKSPTKPRGRRGASFRAVIWRGMRILGVFSLDDLLQNAGVTEGEWAHRRRAASNWIKILVISGHLTRARHADGAGRWRLVNDVGPTPPKTPPMRPKAQPQDSGAAQ